jgi:hypothetical protein
VRIWLTVPVPENYVGHVVHRALVGFHVAFQPGMTYSAKIARISNAPDSQSRTMMVELDAYNSDGSLAPSMYPTGIGRQARPNHCCLYQPRALSPPLSGLSSSQRLMANGDAH